MRFINYDKERVEKVARMHYEYVKGYLKRKKESYRREIYDDVKELLHEEEWQGDFESYNWLKKFLLADVESLRKMSAENKKAMKSAYFKKIYENHFSRIMLDKPDEYSAAVMVRMLDIRVCPYCDRNYINNIIREIDGKDIRGSQLDHFFSKGKYPMLAMCFYNLIPVCGNCNLRKHEKAFAMNPYEEDIERQTFFDIRLKNGEKEITEENVEVNLLYKEAIKENVEILALNEEYKMHSDIAFEILMKATYYNKDKKRELCRNYPQLFGSIEEIDRILYGMDFEHMNQRPLQKFYKDLLKVYDL